MLEAGEIFVVQGVQRPADHSRGGSSVPGEDEVSWKGIAYQQDCPTSWNC